MIKKLVIILLLGGPAYAALPTDVDSLIIHAWNACNIPYSSGSGSVTIAKTIHYMAQGVQEISNALPACPRFDTITVKYGNGNISLGTTFNRIRWVKRISSDTIAVPVSGVEPEAAWQKLGGLSGANGNENLLTDPKYYSIHGNYISFLPVYSSTLGDSALFEVAFYADGALVDGINDNVDIDPDYLPVLIDFVCAKIMETQKQFEWANWFYSKLPAGLGRPSVQVAK